MSKQVKIKNNLPVDLEVYSVFNPGSDDEITPYEYTKCSNLLAGQEITLTTSESYTMYLATFNGKAAEVENKFFYQFPVKSMGVVDVSFGDL